MTRVRIGIIGGSGWCQMPGLADVGQLSVATPFGVPPEVICVGRLAGVEVAFLARHAPQPLLDSPVSGRHLCLHRGTGVIDAC